MTVQAALCQTWSKTQIVGFVMQRLCLLSFRFQSVSYLSSIFTIKLSFCVFLLACSIRGADILSQQQCQHYSLTHANCKYTSYHNFSWCVELTIRITCPCNIYPLKPHFYIEKVGYAVFSFLIFTFLIFTFLIFPPKHRVWVLVRTAAARQF